MIEANRFVLEQPSENRDLVESRNPIFTLAIGLWWLIQDWRNNKPWSPQALFCILWAANIALYVLLPKWSVWNELSRWAGTLTV